MYLVELTKQILIDMRNHKVRSVLALFGIVWGTLSVVVLLALGQGFYTVNKNNMAKLASGVVLVFPGVTNLPYQGMPQGRKINLRAKDVLALPNYISHIKFLSPELRAKVTLQNKNNTSQESVIGVTKKYTKLQKLNFTLASRFFNEDDINKSLYVTVIGDKLAKALFKQENPLHKTIKISGLPFTVIGVIKSQDGGFNFGDPKSSRSAYIPYTTFLSVWGDINISRFLLSPDVPENESTIKKALYDYLGKKYHFNPDDRNALFMPNLAQITHFFDSFFRGIQYFLGFCGAMTLGVGGVGVANIMFLIITERTREIGLRMALGAKNFHVILQIMLEATIIVGIGGFLGFVFSWLTVSILQTVNLPSWLGVPVISYPILFLTLFILIVLALVAGYFPARRASRMDPVVALSH